MFRLVFAVAAGILLTGAALEFPPGETAVRADAPVLVRQPVDAVNDVTWGP